MIHVRDFSDCVFDKIERASEAEKNITIQGDSIVISVPGSFCTYDIPLHECETIHGVLQWIEHMREKSWMTEEMLSMLIALMDEYNGGEGCESCDGTGSVGSVEEREPVIFHPDGVSKALDASSETRADFVETLAHIGDGDVRKGEMLVKNIASRLYHARSKHAWPEEADGKYQAIGVIHAEYQELEQAVDHGEGREREKDEALDVIATAARFWLGEHERND